MLFAPPRPPVRLDMGSIVVLGRSPSCDLPIACPQASRRHAHVAGDKNGFVVADLGSTKGTYVNGERIVGRRRLQPGDRITVGDRSVTFCHVDPALAEKTDVRSDTETAAYTFPPFEDGGEALLGSLREIPAFAALQVLEMGRKTGLFEIVDDVVERRIWFRDGAPVHAVSDTLTGMAAALSVAQAREGRFRFHPGRAVNSRTIEVTVAELLLEAHRQLDEDERAPLPAPAAAATREE